MVLKTIAKYEVKYLQVLDENGKVDEKLMPKLSKEQIKNMYEWMVLTRAFDDKALKLQRRGQMGTYAPMKGQEASQVGSALCFGKDDFVFPAFRENGVFMMRGVPAENLFSYWGGDERGMDLPKGSGIFPVSITVGAHLPHATGAAMAFNIQKKKNAAITYFGDGATSEGDFHEALNFAGVFKAPVVFICQNNQWAISLPVKEQTTSETIAQKAIAYGIEGVKVDGNDVFAVYKTTQDALKRAKSGKGPTLIECFTYRLGDHTTSDDAKKYRKEKEVSDWVKKDPISRLEKYMKKKKIFSESYKKKIWENAEKKMNDAEKRYLAIGEARVEDMFDYTFAELTDDLKEQKAAAMKDKSYLVKGEEKKNSKAMEKGAGVVGQLEEAD